MKATHQTRSTQSKDVMRSVLAAELLLIVPLVAMQFSDEWDWRFSDFLIVGILLAGVGAGFQMLMKGIKNNRRLAVLGAGLAFLMILIWIELAVGLFGTPLAGN